MVVVVVWCVNLYRVWRLRSGSSLIPCKWFLLNTQKTFRVSSADECVVYCNMCAIRWPIPIKRRNKFSYSETTCVRAFKRKTWSSGKYIWRRNACFVWNVCNLIATSNENPDEHIYALYTLILELSFTPPIFRIFPQKHKISWVTLLYLLLGPQIIASIFNQKH